ncbi:uncharacterized protein LOC113798000 [Dermatophagoides pteronyssinus]|uniref:uncharacterized protein LOC113798000 n=1 Tax=Dermatophagoides pteronyssinus TaxID=6956 RepID=UPI003F66C0C4
MLNMLGKITILCTTLFVSQVTGYAGSGGYGGGTKGYSSSSGSRSGGYGGGSTLGLGGSFGSSYGFGSTSGGVSATSAAASGPIQAAVRSRHVIEYVDIDLPQDDVVPQVIDVDAGHLPLILNFKSASSRIQVHQSHEGSEAGEIQETESEDEPQLLRHSVTKPIIQEVREIITPFRRVVQEIRPVEEEVKTIVARGRGRTTDTTGTTGSSNVGSSSTGRVGTGRGSYGGGSGAYGSNSFGSSASKSGY